jgi:hypothetical protein
MSHGKFVQTFNQFGAIAQARLAQIAEKYSQ